jgi:rRNA maturation endonuclease Nob1
MSSAVVQFAKKTGDYAVLSHADLCVLALTYALEVSSKEGAQIQVNGASFIYLFDRRGIVDISFDVIVDCTWILC